MNKCTTKNIYESIDACPGKKNMPGIRRRLYYIPKTDIANWPELPEVGGNESSMKDLAVLKGDFTLAEGKFFRHIDLKDEASNVTFESVGENGTKLFNNQANAIVVGQSDEVKGFARQAVNEDLVYVYQNRNGSFAVIGNEAFTCQTAPSGDTSAESTGASTTTLAINCYDECPVPTYVGKLPISETDQIDCSTGKEEKISA